jgi:Tol biopolymer transport system component
MIPTLLRGGLAVVGLWLALVVVTLAAAPWLNPPSPQLSYVSQFSGNDWYITLMDLRYRVSVDLTRDLFDGPARSRLPSWSPDGSQLAFVSDAGTPQSHVYLYEMRTGALQQLTENAAYYTLPVWSPDGSQLAFGALSSVREGVQVINMTTGTAQEITPPALAAAQSPRFAPDGSLLSFVFVLDDNSRHVYMVEPDGANLRHVFGGTPELHEPVWSPDGRYLTVIDRARQTGQMTVYLLAAADEATYPVFQTYQPNQDLTWSPDGERLTLSVHLGDGTSSIIFVDNLNTALTDGVSAAEASTLSIRYARDTYNTSPLYLPDGEALVFVRQNRDLPSAELYLTDLDGQRVTRLTVNAQNDWFPTWRLPQ